MAIQRIAHSAIRVNSLEDSIKWYNGTFNFKVRSSITLPTRKIAFLYLEQAPDTEIELIEELKKNSDSPDGDNTRIDHVAFAIESVSDTLKRFEHKKLEYLTNEPFFTAAGKQSIYLKGINGELIQLIEL